MRIYRLTRLLMALSLLIVASCQQFEEQAGPIINPGELILKSSAVHQHPDFLSYNHLEFLLENGQVANKQECASANRLQPFAVKPGEYELVAIAASASDNLQKNTEIGDKAEDCKIKVIDINKNIPDILFGTSGPIEMSEKEKIAEILMKRAVALLEINLVGLENAPFDEIPVCITDLYDAFTLNGTPCTSDGTFKEKELILQRDKTGKFTCTSVVMPSDTTGRTVKFKFKIYGKTYVSEQEVKLTGNTKYNLTISSRYIDDTSIKLTPVISYQPWDESITIEDPCLPSLDERKRNEEYTVQRMKDGKWEDLFVHAAKVSDFTPDPLSGYKQYEMGYTMFTDTFDKPVKLRVSRKTPFAKVEIRPSVYGISSSSVTDNSVIFEIKEPRQKISVEFDGNRLENLFIFPDLPDENKPVLEENVLYFGPGIHNMGRKEISYKNNQTIYLDEGAVVYGSIYAKNCNNLSIRGRGILCSSKENHGEGRKPQIETFCCDNLEIEGIMMQDTPNWTMKLVGSDHVHINNIKQIGWIMNSDGMDLICCRHVLVENTFQRNYDDNVTIKAFNGKTDYVNSHTATDGSFTDAGIWTVYYLPQNKFDVYDIEVRNCVFWADKAHNMLVGPESRGIPFSNIRFTGNVVLENRQNDKVYPGTMAVMIADNGTFSDITFSDIEVEDINGGKVLCIQFTNAWAYGNKYGQWAKNITIEKIRYKGHRSTASKIYGLNSTQKIDGVKISDFTVNGEKILHPNTNLDVNEYVENIVFE